MAPNTVVLPVRVISTLAVPERTEVLWKVTLVCWARPAPGALGAAVFSTGKVSPVRAAWDSRKSRASRITPSAGTRLPAESWITSPGTICSASTTVSLPSRQTCTFRARRPRSSSRALPARYSCEKPKTVDRITMARMIAASAVSPTTAAMRAATIRISTSGLSTCRRNSLTGPVRACADRRFAPPDFCRAAAWAEVRPSVLAASAERRAAVSRLG